MKNREEYLRNNALGINNAISVSKLADVIGVVSKGTNNDDVRGWIKDLVLSHSIPIGTSKQGVFVILNDNEREAAARFVERENRADAIRRNGNYIP